MYTKCRFTGKKLLKPGLKLIGAKTKSRDLLYQLFPEHDVYIEPFGGSTTVLVGKEPVPVEMLGDTNKYLIEYYAKALQKAPYEFYYEYTKELNKLQSYGKDRFVWIRDMITDPVMRTWVEAAVWFYLVTKTCMNGIWRLNKDGKCNSSYCGQTTGRGFFTREWFDAVVDRYYDVEFYCQEYQKTIELGATRFGNRFLFLDPPYRYRIAKNGAGTVTTYNGQRFFDKDFVELRDILRTFPGKFLMTINSDDWTKELFSEFEIVEHEINYSCSQTKSGRGNHFELLIANYEIKSKFQELKSQLDAKKEAKTGTVR